MRTEKIECNRLSYTALDEKCLQKYDVQEFVPASEARRLRKFPATALLVPLTTKKTKFRKNMH